MNRTLTHRIFDTDRNLVNMGNSPKTEKPWKDKPMAERMEEPFAGITFEEHTLAGIPNWEKANVRKIEGMLKGFYQAATVALADQLSSPENYYYNVDLVRALNICQKHQSRLCELKKLADTIAKATEKSRFLGSHFERDLCLVLGFRVEIQERSRAANLLMHQLRDKLVAEEDLLPDPTLDPRLWRVQRFVTMNRDTRFIPGLRKVIGVERADAPVYGGGKKGKRYSAARKLRERDRLDLLRAA